jgi:hypothetical protein
LDEAEPLAAVFTPAHKTAAYELKRYMAAFSREISDTFDEVRLV